MSSIKTLTVNILAVIDLARKLRDGGYRLQRVNRGKWIIQENGMIIAALNISLDTTQPQHMLYMEE